ncbi:Hypothetical predicted protein [Cloeon dipterum]|uniref:Vesicular, overexpressed in cancer, prosurvival protein 1 n=1 Tax=Cloeon dipterum TaxID=197152 RepID=A0A8S1DZK3_9INSE|nr:Hypothetical predicted protein [Cloeon dipterum]
MLFCKTEVTFCLLALLSALEKVSAYYCEWDFCDVKSYCCGENQCCSNSYSPWYIWWAGAFVMVLVMWTCNGILRYYRAKQAQSGGIKYQDLESANRQLDDKNSSRSPTL